MSDVEVKMDDLKIERWENSILGIKISLWIIIYKNNFYFLGREVGKSLRFTNPREALDNHVDPEDQITILQLLGTHYREILKKHFSKESQNLSFEFFQNLRGNQKLINELGFYAFCLGSKLEHVKPFKRWVYNVIKTIRETGSYTLPASMQQLCLNNPVEIVEKVVQEAPKYKPRGKKEGERVKIHKSLKKGCDETKDLTAAAAGHIGGTQTWANVRKMESALTEAYNIIGSVIKK